MERKKVESSNIKSIGYDETDELLEVEFNNGGIYQYKNVPKKLYDEIIGAESVGKHFHANIKSFDYEKVQNEL